MSMEANELKVTDLMVGDWVMSFGEPHKIVGVRTDMREPHIKTDMSDTWYEEGIENLLEPIPLTLKILEKNADFHCDEIYYNFYDFSKVDRYGNSISVEVCESKGTVYWTINGNEYGITKLKYVHELQHALKLCKIDKEIVV